VRLVRAYCGARLGAITEEGWSRHLGQSSGLMTHRQGRNAYQAPMLLYPVAMAT
jgi:hypothetical protein